MPKSPPGPQKKPRSSLESVCEQLSQLPRGQEVPRQTSESSFGGLEVAAHEPRCKKSVGAHGAWIFLFRGGV